MTARPAADRLPPAFWALFWGMTVNRLGAFLLLFLTVYLTRRGVGPAEAGLILAGYGVGVSTSAILGGTLADRWGRRPTMVSSLIATAGLTAPLGFVTSPLAVAVLVIFLGLTANVYRPAANAAVADLVPGKDGRTRAFGLLYWAENLGFSAAAVAGGVIAGHSYGLLFLLDAATSLVFAAVIMAGLRDLPAPDAAADGDDRRPGLRAVFQDRVFMVFVPLALVFMWIYFQTSVGLPVTLLRAGVGPGRYGLVLAVNGATVLALQPAISPLLRRADKGHALAAAAVLLGTGFGMFAWARGLPEFCVAVLVWTVGEIVYSVTAPALVADLAPASLRGRYQGVWGASVGVAAVTGPAVGGWLIGDLGTSWLWHVCMALGLGIAVVHWALAGAYRRAPGPGSQVAAHATGSVAYETGQKEADDDRPRADQAVQRLARGGTARRENAVRRCWHDGRRPGDRGRLGQQAGRRDRPGMVFAGTDGRAVSRARCAARRIRRREFARAYAAGGRSAGDPGGHPVPRVPLAAAEHRAGGLRRHHAAHGCYRPSDLSMPSRRAYLAASRRPCACSLARMFRTWLLTVYRLTPRARAICRSLAPCATRASTSSSRLVSTGGGPAGASALSADSLLSSSMTHPARACARAARPLASGAALAAVPPRASSSAGTRTPRR